MFWSILSRFVLAIILFASGVQWNAPPVFLAAFFVAGSTIPLMIRAARENRRLRDQAAGRLEESFESRLQELEERQEAELTYVETETTRRIADLEDRLEFAESMLARLSDTEPARDPNRLQVMTPVN